MNLLMLRNEDAFGGYAFSVTHRDIQLISTIPIPRSDHKDKLRELFFPEKGKRSQFFDPMSEKAFERAE